MLRWPRRLLHPRRRRLAADASSRCAAAGTSSPAPPTLHPPQVFGSAPWHAVEAGQAAGDLVELCSGWVEACGGEVASEQGVEVSPLVSYAGEGLQVGRGWRLVPALLSWAGDGAGAVRGRGAAGRVAGLALQGAGAPDAPRSKAAWGLHNPSPVRLPAPPCTLHTSRPIIQPRCCPAARRRWWRAPASRSPTTRRCRAQPRGRARRAATRARGWRRWRWPTWAWRRSRCWAGSGRWRCCRCSW
jgi:hypothetical protein